MFTSKVNNHLTDRCKEQKARVQSAMLNVDETGWIMCLRSVVRMAC